MKFLIKCFVPCFALGNGDQDTILSIEDLRGSEQVRERESDRSYTRCGRGVWQERSAWSQGRGLPGGGDV